MKSREISRSKIGPFSLACTDSYIGIGWEYQSSCTWHRDSKLRGTRLFNSIILIFSFNMRVAQSGQILEGYLQVFTLTNVFIVP